MDAYLQIAETVLRTERRPLTPRAILAAAYRNGIVPVHLFGKTQHKTLGARLSEDILARREKSLFFRTAPGRFFIREFLADVSVPEQYRQPIAARRRARELIRGPALAVNARDLRKIGSENTIIEPGKVLSLLPDYCYYEEPRNASREHSVFLWSFVSVCRDNEVLSYRLGRYREDRDAFISKRTIGFSSLVLPDARTLFGRDDFGITESGVQATKLDLDIPVVPTEEPYRSSRLMYFVWLSHPTENALLAVINFACPEWFEPVRRRLALNDLRWIDARRVNDLDDFDPWSRVVLLHEDRANSLREHA